MAANANMSSSSGAPPRRTTASRVPPSVPPSAERRSLKWSSPSPSWKENLRKECLEKARKRRMEKVKNLRENGMAVSLFQSHSPSSAIGSIVDSAMDSRGYSALTEARSLVQESLAAGQIGVLASSSTPSPTTHAAPSSPFLFSSPMAMGDMHDFVYSTPTLGHSWTSAHNISENELYLLMQEVEVELQGEEAMLTQELLAVERQHEQEQRYLEEQIADYENWMADNQLSKMD